jgi:hypothetical protein
MAKSQKFALPLPKKAIEADEVAKEKSYDEFYKELYVLFKKDKGERKPKLVKQVREHLKTFEGKKLLFDLLEHFEKRKDKHYSADQEKIIKIIKEEILIATKLPKDWKKKEVPHADLPESLIPLDKIEENQHNTHTKSFKPFFLTTPEQQREVQLEADLSKAEQKIAQLEEQLEETLVVLATLKEENRHKLEQIKVLELRVEEAESVSKSLTNSQKEYIPIADRAPQVAPKLYEDREIDPETGKPITILQFLERYYGKYLIKFNPELEVDLLYQDQLKKLDIKALIAINSYCSNYKLKRTDFIKPKKERIRIEKHEDAKTEKDAIRIMKNRYQYKYKSQKSDTPREARGVRL